MMETKPEVEMSDIANETQEPVTVTVADLVNSIEKGDAFTSSKMFNDLLQGRIDDALEQEKIRIANSVYNDAEEEISDEEVEAELEDLESDDEEVETEAETEVETEAETEVEAEAEMEIPEPDWDTPLARGQLARELEYQEGENEEEHEEPEDTMGLYADEIEDILSDEESEDESEEENV